MTAQEARAAQDEFQARGGYTYPTLRDRVYFDEMREIRDRFLRHSAPHSHVVVHGHTICDAPEDCGNRIGIDTGAYASGRLTALALEAVEGGVRERFLATGG